MRRYVVFGAVALALLLSAIDNSAVAVAFHAMVKEFTVPLVVVGWVLTAYQLVQTIGMAVSGKISDALGARRAFIIYTALFLTGSVLCSLSHNVYMLIGARIIQALGGGGFMPCAAGIISSTFPEQRQRYIGLFSSIFPIGSIIGPNLGGWLVSSFGWRSIYWINVPLAIIVLILARLLIPAFKGEGFKAGIDFTGAGLLLGTLTSFMLALTEIGNNIGHISWPYAGALLGLSAVLLVIFLRWESRAREPVIDLGLLKEKEFVAANIYNTVYGICALGIFSLIPLFAVTVYGMSTLESGAILTPRSIGMMVASTMTSFSLVKWGYRKPILAGTLTVVGGLSLIALQPHGIGIFGFHIGTIPILLVLIGICGIGHGVCTPAANNACIELMPDKVATITGLRGMFRNLGSTLGVAFATLMLSIIPDPKRGFYVVFFAPVALMLIFLPTIWIMPASPNVGPLKKAAPVPAEEAPGA